MAERIPGEIISPMIEDGVLKWCKGDTFSLHLRLELYAMGEPFALSEGSEVEVSFRDRSDYAVTLFYVIAEKDNCITLEFDKDITSAFDEGRYTYDVRITDGDGERRTVAKDNVAVVI